VAAILRSIQSAVQDGNRGDDFPAAVVAETLRQDAALIGGIAAYRRHEWRRTLLDPPAIWSEGGTRLLDYGAVGGAAGGTVGGGSGGRPVLFVPSLINRAYVLDLAEGRSMLRWLAGRGVRPLLLDWGWPGEIERSFTLTDYVAGRMERAMAAAALAAGAPPVLAGYCMGGTLAVAAAQRRPDLVSGLALLAAPWDFHAPDPQRALQAAAALPMLEPALAFSQTLPVDLLQSLFALLDPWAVADKYRAFARLRPDGERARMFVALEDWLNDGVPLVAEVARTCLGDWYGKNAPARGNWRIVPPESARPLAELVRGAVLYEPAAGHIGMAAGARAETALWRPLLDWLSGLSRPGPRMASPRPRPRKPA
jgi:polyhydroxyalkanoate synthase